MNNDDKILKALEDLKEGQKALEAGQKTLQGDVKTLNGKVDTLEHGQMTLQADVTAMKGEVEKIPAIGKQLERQGKLLNGITATMATILEEQQTQRVDIRSLHTEVHETREELKGEMRAARDEAKQDNIDLKATVVKKIQSVDRRVTNIEEHEGIENPDKN